MSVNRCFPGEEASGRTDAEDRGRPDDVEVTVGPEDPPDVAGDLSKVGRPSTE